MGFYKAQKVRVYGWMYMDIYESPKSKGPLTIIF